MLDGEIVTHFVKGETTMADFIEDGQNIDEEEDDIIILYNQATDKDEEFVHLATLDVENRWYIIMKPAQALPDIDEDEVLIYELVEKEAKGEVETEFVPIEDEKILDKVYEEFRKMVEEQFGDQE